MHRISRLLQILWNLLKWVWPEEVHVTPRATLRAFLAVSELTGLKAAWMNTAGYDPTERILESLTWCDKRAKNERRSKGLSRVLTLLFIGVMAFFSVSLKLSTDEVGGLALSDLRQLLVYVVFALIFLVVGFVFLVDATNNGLYCSQWSQIYFSDAPGYFQDVRALMVFFQISSYQELVDTDDLRDQAYEKLVEIAVDILANQKDPEFNDPRAGLGERNEQLHAKLKREFDMLLRFKLTGTTYHRLFQEASKRSAALTA